MDYKHLDLKDRSDVVVAYLKSDSIPQADHDRNDRQRAGKRGLGSLGRPQAAAQLRAVQYMSSAMLGKLVQLHKRCKADKIKLKLCNISKNVMEVFEITKLNKLFEIKPDEAAALAAF